MDRLPALPEPTDEITAEVFRTFQEEGRQPIALYRALAHSPRMLRAYSGLARALRYEAETPRELRELAILRTAQLTGSAYEWAHHRAMAATAGVPEEQVREIAGWPSSSAFDERERAVLRCVDEMDGLALSDDAVGDLGRLLGASGTVEIVLLVAFYQAVARLIQAFGLEVEPDYRGHLDGWPPTP
jgi:4-carboxymuconolactone decarboxylase